MGGRKIKSPSHSPYVLCFFFLSLSVSNPEAILASNLTKPIVTEHGPYVYRKFKVKFDFLYGEDYDNRQTLQFREWTYYEFDSTQTDPSLNPYVDTYTTFNLPFQAVTNALKGLLFLEWSNIEAQCPEYAGSNDMARLFTSTRTVQELMFGYIDCITKAVGLPASGLTPANTFPGLLGTNVLPANVTSTANLTAFITPDVIYTGDDDGDYMRQYFEVGLQQYLTNPLSGDGLWGSTPANRVFGTDGAQFKRNIKEGSTLNAWTDDLMRHAPMVNYDSLHVRDLHGLDLLRFTLDPKILKNVTYVPENAAYYVTQYNGILDLSHAKENLPIYMSKPHFLDADAVLVDSIIGMSPNRDLHDTFLDVEPISGATMRANKRLQVNILTSPFSFETSVPTFYPNVAQHYTPVTWINENGEISSSKASDFRADVYGALDAIKYINLIPTIIGSIVIGASVLIFFLAISRGIAEQNRASGGINNQY